MPGRLNGRLARLEALVKPRGDHCRACGRRHVQPMTMDLARRIVGPVSIMASGLRERVAANPAPKLCLCDSCCGDPKDRTLARMSHERDTLQSGA